MSAPRRWILFIVTAVGGAAFTAATGHEIDQCSVPLGQTYIDVGPEFTQMHYRALVRTVHLLNDRVRAAQAKGLPEAEIRRITSADEVGRVYHEHMPNVFLQVDQIWASMRERRMADNFPGFLTAHMPPSRLLANPLLLRNPNRLQRLAPSCMVEINGVWLGADKHMHFCHAGYMAYEYYRRGRNHGFSPDDAVRYAMNAAEEDSLLSERLLVGLTLTGIGSNADLVANYAGMKFYQNLLEPVRIGDRHLPPMLARDGLFLRVQDHVRPTSDFFTVFVTPHWDEVLNPNVYRQMAGAAIREEMAARCSQVRAWYRDENGEPRTPYQFQTIARELRTLYGENYGYMEPNSPGEVIAVSTVCYGPATTLPGKLADAAAKGDVRALRELLRRLHVDTDVGQADGIAELYLPGTTALHVAAAHGQAIAAALLLEHRADVNARTGRGVTPLHKSAAHVGVARMLLSAGADPAVGDWLQRTPLHWAVGYGAPEVVALLLENGADPKAVDGDGESPLHLAVRREKLGCVRRLMAGGAAADQPNRAGQTALHLAVTGCRASLLPELLQHTRDVDRPDIFGDTPLHVAVRRGDSTDVRLLMRAGSSASKRNHLGLRPLDLVRRHADAEQRAELEQLVGQPKETVPRETARDGHAHAVPDRGGD